MKKIINWCKRAWEYMAWLEEQRIKAMIKAGKGWS